MTTSEFSNEFDILYNNIMSNQAPGLDEYEKSVFLTKAQNEILLSYFNPKLNKVQEGFDGSEKRQIDFSNLISVVSPIKESTYQEYTDSLHPASNAAFYEIPSDLLLYINEFVDVQRNGITKRLTVVPLQYTEYNRLMSKPFTRPLKNQAWRLVTEGFGLGIDYKSIALMLSLLEEASASEGDFYKVILDKNIHITNVENRFYLTFAFNSGAYAIRKDATLEDIYADDFVFDNCLDITSVKDKLTEKLNVKMTRAVQLIPGPVDVISKYLVRYLRRPSAIVLEDLGEELSIEGISSKQECILDPILHPEILQRAVELAKAAYVGDLSTMISVGNASATDKGIISTSKS